MGYIENKLNELYNYLPPLTKKDDFDLFWQRTLQKAEETPLNFERIKTKYPLDGISVYNIAYNGYDETRIKGLLLLPKTIGENKIPCVIHYHGYGGNKGRPVNFLHWILMGFAVVSIDCRGQSGMTGDLRRYPDACGQTVCTKGLFDKEHYYFKAVYADCIKAIDFASAQPEIDNKRIIIEGGSQGGGIGMAVCSLDSRPFLGLVDVPSNSDLASRVDGGNGSFAAVRDIIKAYPDRLEDIMDTLSYFDTMNMSEKIRCPILASVGLIDEVCPPKCYAASFNRISSPKILKAYPYCGHEGGGSLHEEEKIRFASSYCF